MNRLTTPSSGPIAIPALQSFKLQQYAEISAISEITQGIIIACVPFP